MERGGDHRADIAEKGAGQHLHRAGFPQNLRHADRAAHEQKNHKIDFAKLVFCQDTDAWECRHESDAHADNGRIQLMDEIRRPDTHSRDDPKCSLLL